MASYQGHRNWDYWNVSLWIANDEGLYFRARDLLQNAKKIRDAAEVFVDDLAEQGISKTPDGARYTVPNVTVAMRGLVD